MTALKLDVRENEARWNAMPALEGVNRVGPARAGATVLATHPFLTVPEGTPMPVVAAANVGKGRSLAVTTDTSWHWSFLAAGPPGAQSAAGDDGRTFVKFWDNAIRWLIRDPALRYLRIDLEGPGVPSASRCASGSAPGCPTTARRGSSPIALTVTPLKGGGGPPPVPVHSSAASTDAEGEVRVEFTPPAPGAYRIVARATLSGRPVSDESVVVVAPRAASSPNPAAREDTLRAVARTSGGRYLGKVSVLPALPAHPPRIVRIGKHRDIEVRSRPFMLRSRSGCSPSSGCCGAGSVTSDGLAAEARRRLAAFTTRLASGLRPVQREHHREGRARARRAVDLNRAAVGADDAERDGEAEPGAEAHILRREERLENLAAPRPGCPARCRGWSRAPPRRRDGR